MNFTNLQQWKQAVQAQWPGAKYRTVVRNLLAVHELAPGMEAGRWSHLNKRGYVALNTGAKLR